MMKFSFFLVLLPYPLDLTGNIEAEANFAGFLLKFTPENRSSSQRSKANQMDVEEL